VTGLNESKSCLLEQVVRRSGNRTFRDTRIEVNGVFFCREEEVWQASRDSPDTLSVSHETFAFAIQSISTACAYSESLKRRREENKKENERGGRPSYMKKEAHKFTVVMSPRTPIRDRVRS